MEFTCSLYTIVPLIKILKMNLKKFQEIINLKIMKWHKSFLYNFELTKIMHFLVIQNINNP